MAKLILFDAYSLIYRAFYAIQSLTGPAGQPVNAVYGFARMVRKMIADHRPTHGAAVFDLGAPQHRLALLPSYKEQRPPTPPDLEIQLPAIREFIEASQLPIVEVEGEEADDLIAALAVQAGQAGTDVLIASNDKDFMQIVSPQIGLLRFDGKETVVCTAAGVDGRYGVQPEQMVDFLSLLGDAVDNIKGVPGVGEKTAAGLLRQFGTLDNLLANLDSVPRPKLRESIRAAADQLKTNRTLIALRSDTPLPVQWDELRLRFADIDRLRGLFKQCGFKSLLSELEKAARQQPDLFGGF